MTPDTSSQSIIRMVTLETTRPMGPTGKTSVFTVMKMNIVGNGSVITFSKNKCLLYSTGIGDGQPFINLTY
jgi:hypothetical protein